MRIELRHTALWLKNVAVRRALGDWNKAEVRRALGVTRLGGRQAPGAIPQVARRRAAGQRADRCLRFTMKRTPVRTAPSRRFLHSASFHRSSH